MVDDISSKMANVVLMMREYQKINNIKRRCITNAQFLYDNMTRISTKNDIQTRSVIVVGLSNEDTYVILGGHIVVVLDGDVIEPSYDIYSINDVCYYDNVKDFMEDCSLVIEKDLIKKTIQNFLEFQKYEKRINSGGFLVSGDDLIYYNEQADYIEGELYK